MDDVVECLSQWQNDPDPDDMIEYLEENGALPIYYKLVVLLTMYRNSNLPAVGKELSRISSLLTEECLEQDCNLDRPMDHYIVDMVDSFNDCLSNYVVLEELKNSWVSHEARRLTWNNYSEDGYLTLYAGVRNYRKAMLESVRDGYSWTGRPPLSTTPNWDVALHQFTDDDLIQIYIDFKTWKKGDPDIVAVWALTAVDQCPDALWDHTAHEPYSPLEWLILPNADLVADGDPYIETVTYSSLRARGATWVQDKEVYRDVKIYTFYIES